LWKLTAGTVHATDPSNASRTLLYGIRDGIWHRECLRTFDVDASLLPEIRSSAGDFGSIAADLPAAGTRITGILGDQQAALFGQCGWQPGVLKNTYGTGLFLMGFTGETLVDPGNLVNTVAWEIDGHRSFSMEGSVFIGGALVQWLRDGLGFLQTASQCQEVARSVPDANGVVFVPALAGLGAPYWDPDARGLIIGITQDTKPAHIVRAGLESMAWQTRDVVDAMCTAIGEDRDWCLRVDGGACANDLLMQMQADALHMPVERPTNLECTAMGAAAIAGVGAGLWDQSHLVASRRIGHRFTPSPGHNPDPEYARWQKAVKRSLAWAK
jgi:glycerol kinase